MPDIDDHIITVPSGTERDADPWRAALLEDTLIVTDPAPAASAEDRDIPQSVETQNVSDPDTSEGETAESDADTGLPPADVVNDPSLYRGTDGDDVVALTPVLSRIDGGAGTDTVVVNGLFASAQILFGSGAEVLLDPGPDAPALTLDHVERIAFDDGTIAFDDDGLAGQAYRLYQACFDRTPDAEGLGFWIKQLDAGNVTLTEAANLFLDSEEFASVYGDPDALADVHYLALLYANVLNRVPDEAGFGFWREQQENGITRADMLVHFSESAENKALVAEAIDDGIWYF